MIDQQEVPMKWKMKILLMIPAYMLAVMLLTLLLPLKKAGTACHQLFSHSSSCCSRAMDRQNHA
jgi:hypothetical protein